ncbi:hypothetical protein CCR75_005884 [Bremia lactucae]|uniref:TFIIS N-terminal domain-containing protein n=1 Tax=Bremia lactucae TaxID=4779 RepID=A0A976IFF4_BRELC|nr:hypothetical protein CCR75_005884 [Bremia lactucae]
MEETYSKNNVRIREPQRFPLGTRVANPLEGRTGEITAFDTDSGLYTLVYNDNHHDILTAIQTEQFIIRTSVNDATEQISTINTVDPNQFLGVTVTKSSKSYDGKVLTTSGHVTQYFADIQRYRVLFSDGLYSDMTLEEVQQTLNVKDSEFDSETKCSRESFETIMVSKKKQKRIKSSVFHEEIKERPLNTQRFDSRKTAYTMCREVLRIIMSQKKVVNFCSEKQKIILSNTGLQPKKALEAFVESDGLIALEKLLVYWFRLETTRPASLLVLKLLAILPNVKELHLRKTNIARVLRSIEKLSASMIEIDLVYGDLAHWIIQKWAKTAMNRSFQRSPRDLLLDQHAQIRRAAPKAPICIVPDRNRLKQKETMRLEALRAQSDGFVNSFDSNEAVVLYLPQLNSLGSETSRRPMRQTQVIESLAAKINRDYEDSWNRHSISHPWNEDTNGAEGRIVFGKPQLMHFQQDVPVVDLFATTRSKVVGNNKDHGGGTSCGNNLESLPLPNKTRVPKKSILKVTEDLVAPASQVTW